MHAVSTPLTEHSLPNTNTCVVVGASTTFTHLTSSHLLSELLDLIDDFPSDAFIHHLLRGSDIKENEKTSVCMSMVLRREGGVYCVGDLNVWDKKT